MTSGGLVPADAGVAIATGRLVRGKRVVLLDARRLACRDQRDRLAQGVDAHREELVEVEVAHGLVGADSTRFWRRMGPVSMPWSGQKMVRPVSVSPLMIGQFIALEPRCSGSRLGWYWIVPRGGSREDFARDDVRDEGHHAEVGFERCARRPGPPLSLSSMRVRDDGSPAASAAAQRGSLRSPIGAGRAHADDLDAVFEQALEDGLPERSLTHE